ncbi:DUF6602 domain-containing protein [Ruegeria arenilitoris]|uniref:DUF6602 domain-containing protein n=1 Tax=Ruegeria arenilitoris TaxID=1173585 RepID=UPI001479F549|nr:DUF6602 domain-containing protein [Ruegeria arenilitoris]
MTNKVFINILNRRIGDFINAFDYDAKSIFSNETNKLFHAGEYGLLKEKAVISLLRLIVPENLSISSGFLLTSNGEISTQCDIIIYDKSRNPVIRDGAANFFLLESVYAVGEVKSKLNATRYRDALEKLARQKALGKSALSTDGFDPANNAKDNIITFLVCQKLDCDYLRPELYQEAYSNRGVDDTDWHNLVISIEDGELLYKMKPSEHLTADQKRNIGDIFTDHTEWAWAYPVLNGHKIQYARRKIPEHDNFWHIKDFLFLLGRLLAEKNMPNSSTLEYFSDQIIDGKNQ